jgi:hypothetical protein
MRGDRNHGQARCAIVAVLGVEGEEAVRRARQNFARRGEPRTTEGRCLGLAYLTDVLEPGGPRCRSIAPTLRNSLRCLGLL